ncbi:MAG: hypothetical protein LBT10_03975, partial [Methanobrevibacter sp.]|nr:hypothetical protein [Methanobrevibacter sp.]
EESKNIEEFLIEYRKHNQETIDWNAVRADGKLEGLKEGEIKGIEKGLKEGKIRKEKIIIENMKKYGLSDEEINKIINNE